MKIRATLVLTLILIVFLDNLSCKKKLKKRYIDTDNTKVFRDQSLSPDNTRTKIFMLKAFTASVFDQLGIPDTTIESSLNATSGGDLIGCMELYKSIARGDKTGKDLINLEKHVKITGLKDRLVDEVKVNNAVEFIKEYVSRHDLAPKIA